MGPFEPPPADQNAGQREEIVVEFEAPFPSDSEALEPVEQGKALLDDVAEPAQAPDARRALTGDHRQGPAFAQFTTDSLGVVRLAQHGVNSPRLRPSHPAPRDLWSRSDPDHSVASSEGLGLEAAPN